MEADLTGRAPEPCFENDAALDAFVASWRAGRLPKATWTHGAHVAVCAYYAFGGTPRETLLGVMRAGIVAYNEAVGTANTLSSGYHETLTRLWCGLVADALTRADPATRLDAVRMVVAELGNARTLHQAFYTFDVVGDPTARATWVAPDIETKQDK